MAKRGLGSDKMSKKKKKEIQRKGGKASGKSRGDEGRGSNLTDEDRARGGRRSHSGGRPSEND